MTSAPADTSPSSGQSSPPRIDKRAERVREMFAQIAPRYDLLNHLLSLGIDIQWRRRVVRLLDLQPGLPVLDCCTGTGDLALMMAAAAPEGVSVIGTDFCPQMLEVAQRKCKEVPASRPVEFQLADAQELPFDDATFQAVTVAFGLRNVQDTDQGLREMARVCRPGGQVCVLEFSQPTMPGFRHVYSFYFNKVLPKVGQWLARNEKDAYHYLPASVQQFPSGKELAGRLEAHGLTDVRVIPLTFGVASIYLGRRGG
ncbi:MAG: demethylmenaquinone methyltransferase [Pirellulaceae bacterium]|nr:MAG: demethylmenaquinone methyltransferase [Pirellulaceae bacterium]